MIREPIALQPAFADKLSAIADTFKAWRVPSTGGQAQPIAFEAASLREAVNAAAPRCCHKDTLLLLQCDGMTGTKMLHVHRIKQGKREYRVNRETGVPGWIAPLYADAQFSVPVLAFEPVEPWRWSPGADVVGIDRDVIQAELEGGN